MFKYSCLHFPSITPLWLCLCVLYTCSLMTLPLFPPIIPTLLPCGYCQFVLYFNVSGYILLAYLFCSLGSTYRQDHIVFVFHCLAYFTCIMLSGSIHTVAKGRNFFFFLLCSILLSKCTTVFDPLTSWQALRYLPTLGYCKLCCYEHWGA